MRWSRDESGRRVVSGLVVVLDAVASADGEHQVAVAPWDDRFDMATDLDLILDAHDSGVGFGGIVAMGEAGWVAAEALGVLVGTLEPPVRASLTALRARALGMPVDLTRVCRGTEPDGPDDPRVAHHRRLGRLLRTRHGKTGRHRSGSR
jgi:hypothetical protein